MHYEDWSVPSEKLFQNLVPETLSSRAWSPHMAPARYDGRGWCYIILAIFFLLKNVSHAKQKKSIKKFDPIFKQLN